MFAVIRRIRFQPFDGLQVRVRGKFRFISRRANIKYLVESLEPVGEGALRVAFEQIKAKLKKEGLFDEELKRELPLLPRRVGVVTSPTGAAIHDILNISKAHANRSSSLVRRACRAKARRGNRARDKILPILNEEPAAEGRD